MMKKIINFFKNDFNHKEFWIEMLIFLSYFTFIAIILLVSKTWGFGKELLLFYAGGFFVSAIINLFKQIK